MGVFVTGIPALLLFALVATCTANMNPCHQNKRSLGKGGGGFEPVTCKNIRFPPKLCRACRLKPPRPNGNFRNCNAIYDLSTRWCRDELRKYARLNAACDPVRKKQVRNFDHARNREGLDYFVYSVCEQCCDCVPRGSLPSQYPWRKANNKLLTPNRGNCPAHAWYDICTVWPDIESITNPNGFPKPNWKVSKLCPKLTNWIGRPANNPWLFKSYTWVDPPIKNFFDQFFKVVKCSDRDIWSRCTDLESKQNRL